MMLFSLLLITILVPSFVVSIIPNNKRADDIHSEVSRFYETIDKFQSWKARFNKTYSTDTEEQLRFGNFRSSLKRIDERNVGSSETVFGLTKYSDLSTDEFKSLLGYRPRAKVPDVPVFEPTTFDAPSTYDWRNNGGVTAVKDQGQCGSCWAFSTVENVESIYMLSKKISPSDMPPLSVQEVVDCDTTDAGCNGGDTPTAYAYILSAGGLESESDYPYTAADGTCAFDASKVKATFTNWKYATQNSDEPTMQNALVSMGPLSICVDAEPWQDYSSGVMMASQCSNSLDHCVQAVGYDMTASTPFWIVRNSWGADWGESGYIRLQYGQDTCGCADEATSSYI